jgi:hypothetical protein
METILTERDLEDLSEPTRSVAFEFLWLLRECGHSEEFALRLAMHGAYEFDAIAAASEALMQPVVIDGADDDHGVIAASAEE